MLGATPMDWTSIVREAMPCVVNISTETLTNKNVTVAAWKRMKALDVSAIKKMASAAAGHSPDLGIVLVPMSKAARQFYKFSATSGVVVVAVDPACEAFTSGIGAGDAGPGPGTSQGESAVCRVVGQR
jgi:hypothetical protein